MACSCSKSSKATAASVHMATPPTPGVTWEAVFPSGTVQSFPARWQADRAVAMLGGRVRRVTTKV